MIKNRLKYEVRRYEADGSIAVQSYDEEGFPWCRCSVCLIDYGYRPNDDEIFIPAYQITDDDLEEIKNDIVKEVIEEIAIGPYGAKCLHVRLNDEILKEAGI